MTFGTSAFGTAPPGAAPVPASSSTAYDTEVVADSPSLRWKFDEVAGSTTWVAANGGVNLTAVQNATAGATSVFAVAQGKAVALNNGGLTGALTSPLATTFTSPFTVEALFILNTMPSGSPALFTTQFPDGGSPLPIVFGINNVAISGGANNISIGWFSGGWDGVASSVALATNTPYHAVGTYDGTTLSLYLNGALVGSAVKTSGRDYRQTNTMYVGRRWDFPDFLDGRVDDLALYPTGLSASRVSAHYAALTGVATTAGSAALSSTSTLTATATATPRVTAALTATSTLTTTAVAARRPTLRTSYPGSTNFDVLVWSMSWAGGDFSFPIPQPVGYNTFNGYLYVLDANTDEVAFATAIPYAQLQFHYRGGVPTYESIINATALPAGTYDLALESQNTSAPWVPALPVGAGYAQNAAASLTATSSLTVTATTTTTNYTSATARRITYTPYSDTSNPYSGPAVGPRGAQTAWWVYTPSAAGSVQCDTIGSGFDTYLFLYAADATTVLASDDDSGGNFTSKIIYNVVAGATYYIAVTSYASTYPADGLITFHTTGPAPQPPTVDGAAALTATSTLTAAADGGVTVPQREGAVALIATATLTPGGARGLTGGTRLVAASALVVVATVVTRLAPEPITTETSVDGHVDVAAPFTPPPTGVAPTADPTVAPTLVRSTGGAFTAGTYEYAYQWWAYDVDHHTALSPPATVTVAAGDKVTVTVPASTTADGYVLWRRPAGGTNSDWRQL